MKTKLILVEGLPGSGKSTISKRIASYLQDRGIDAKCYNEGDAHPADFAWCAYLSKKNYDALRNEFPQYAKELEKHATMSSDHVIIPYLNLKLNEDGRALREKLEHYEIYSGKLSSEDFLQLHVDRWTAFCQQAQESDSVHVFECAYLQNHVNELLLFHEASNDSIIDYQKQLIKTVKPLNPVLFYLAQKDVPSATKKIASIRVSKNPNARNWIDFVIDYLADSPYGRTHSIKDIDGVIDYFVHRQSVELQAVDSLSLTSSVLYKDEDDWDQLFDSITDVMDKEFN